MIFFIFILIVALLTSVLIFNIGVAQIKKPIKISLVVLVLACLALSYTTAIIFVPFTSLFIEKIKKPSLNKYGFLVILSILILTRGFIFDGFKEIKFFYECGIKNNQKVEIFDQNFTTNYFTYYDSKTKQKCNMDSKNCPKKMGLFHTEDIYSGKKRVGKLYRYYMPYNELHRGIVSMSNNNHGRLCFKN